MHFMNIKSPKLSRIGHGRSKGFTLLELMIVVAIVAILTTIAYPNYRDYVIRGQLVDATQGLASVRANMERYFQDNRTYLPIGTFTPPCGAANVPYGRFNISCPPIDATHFTAIAVGIAAPLTGFQFNVNEANTQWTVVGPPAPASFATCMTAWVTKTGGC
jgi:prepilin-type N-terminal cleavage/methylation domain-containing protein